MAYRDNAFSQRYQTSNDLHRAVMENKAKACKAAIEEMDVNIINFTGETALHLAAKNTAIDEAIIPALLDAGADVTATNVWGQTPLHYAAIGKSLKNLKILLNASRKVLMHADSNGYNVLHCLIQSDPDYGPNPMSSRLSGFSVSGESTSIATNRESHDCVEGIKLLVGAGVNINSQTKYGHSVLHLASARPDSIVASYILENVQNMNPTLLTQMDENFLHVYVQCQDYEYIEYFLFCLDYDGFPGLKELLNQKDVYGRTPCSLLLDSVYVTKDVVKTLLKCGADICVADNFGNTALHRITMNPYPINVDGILEHLILNGVGINKRNIYVQSVASMVYIGHIFEVFRKHELDLHTRDRWGRTPLVNAMNQRPNPNFLKKFIDEGKADINSKDSYGSTPLHFAAYNNFEEQVNMLLSYKADVNLMDNVGDKPLDTARRHWSFSCFKSLQQSEDAQTDILYTRERSFEKVILDIPKSVTSSKMKTLDDVKTLLSLPENNEEFHDFLMGAYYLRDPIHTAEVEEITTAVREFVSALIKQVGKYDSRFEMRIYPTGSSAEGTKIGPPDEFDFVLCLDKVNEICNVAMPGALKEAGYACLRFKDVPVKEDFQSFSDRSANFLAFPYLQYLFRFIKRAIHESGMWKGGNLRYNFDKEIHIISGKPVFNLEVFWNGSIYKHLKISIDLVPAVHKPGWWPSNVKIDEKQLATENVKAAGCFLLLQTYKNQFDREPMDTMNDSVSHTCNTTEDEQSNMQDKMLRISVAPAEICLMKSLPVEFRNAYALAKIMKSDQICPEIEIDMLPTERHLKTKYDTTKPETVKPSNVIKSYMLKNCIFYLYEAVKDSFNSGKNLTVPGIAAEVYTRLFEASRESYLQPYFMAYGDVFEFRDRDISCFKSYMWKLKRALCINMILGVLNHPPKKIGMVDI